MSTNSSSFDVLIIGAGPAGSTAALALKDSGLKVGVLDKATFPRDKVCGDAIPGTVPKALKAIDPALLDELEAFPEKVNVTATRVVAPNNTAFDIHWKSIAYNSPRLDFDNCLYQMAKKHSPAEFREGVKITEAVIEAEQIKVEDDRGNHYTAKIVIGAGGAHSVLAKQLAGIQVDRAHYMGAVRAYYTNVADMHEYLTEIYLLKAYLPGYLWVFPLPHGRVNVGFGMTSDAISDRKINLNKAMLDILENHPILAPRFKNAQLEGPVKGFGLPTGSRKVPVSGDRFLLTGDAASLIDPISGDGIGNAMWSGKIAADHVVQCFQANRFDAAFNQAYNTALYAKLWPELSQHARLQRFLKNKSWLINWSINLAARNRFVRNWVQKQV